MRIIARLILWSNHINGIVWVVCRLDPVPSRQKGVEAHNEKRMTAKNGAHAVNDAGCRDAVAVREYVFEPCTQSLQGKA